MKALWPEQADPLGKYAPDQPRVPAGNGARSGEWEFRGGGASTSRHDGRIVVASGDKKLLPEANSSEFDEITGHVAPKQGAEAAEALDPLDSLPVGIGPGPFAGRSIPAGPRSRPTAAQSLEIDAIGGEQAVTLAGQKIRVHQTEGLSAIINYRRRSPSREMNNISFRIVRSVARPKAALCGLTKIIGDKKMRGLDWVMSAGGALICIGDDYAPLWGGILRLTIDSGIKKNDYERTYGLSKYAAVVPLSKGNALVFGQGPLDTSFWIDKNQTIHIIRIYFCDSHTDDASLEKTMQNLDESLFERPREVLDFDVASSRLVMFDLANDGTDIDDKVVSVDIEPGRYRVLTQTYDPDPTCSFVMHRFDRLA